MKLQQVSAIVLILVTLSCNDDGPDTVCSQENPVEDLAWLQAEIQEMATSGMSQYLYVSQAKYGFITVFIFGNCCPNCLTITPVYNCSGEHIGNVGSGEGDIDPSILLKDELVWKPDNSACNFQ